MNNFFFTNGIIKENSDIDEYKDSNNIFFHKCNEHTPSRDFKQGVSFRCRKFEYGNTYHNDDFVQDFVIYNKSIYMCTVESTTNIPGESTDWELAVSKGDEGPSGKDAPVPKFYINSKGHLIVSINGETTDLGKVVGEGEFIPEDVVGNVTWNDIGF